MCKPYQLWINTGYQADSIGAPPIMSNCFYLTSILTNHLCHLIIHLEAYQFIMYASDTVYYTHGPGSISLIEVSVSALRPPLVRSPGGYYKAPFLDLFFTPCVCCHSTLFFGDIALPVIVIGTWPQMSKIKFYLSKGNHETVVCAFITSYLDYCNALLFGISQGSIAHWQLVQNTTAQFLSGASKREHITPILSSFHWLLVCLWIHFNILFKRCASFYLHGRLHQHVLTQISRPGAFTYSRNTTQTVLCLAHQTGSFTCCFYILSKHTFLVPGLWPNVICWLWF